MNFSLGHLYKPYKDFSLSLVLVFLRTALLNCKICTQLGDSVQLWVSGNQPLAKLWRHKVRETMLIDHCVLRISFSNIKLHLFQVKHLLSSCFLFYANLYTNFLIGTFRPFRMQWPFGGNFDMNKVVHLRSASDQKRVKKPPYRD